MALVAAAHDAGASDVIVPLENAVEGAAIGGVRVRGARALGEVTRHLAGLEELDVVDAAGPPIGPGAR